MDDSQSDVRLAKIMQDIGQSFMPFVERLVEAFTAMGSAMRVMADFSWQMESELCFREYARRMNAGPWRWRKRSWRRLNIEQRTAARLWWNRYGRAAHKER